VEDFQTNPHALPSVKAATLKIFVPFRVFSLLKNRLRAVSLRQAILF
jgi:hypothetical protein